MGPAQVGPRRPRGEPPLFHLAGTHPGPLGGEGGRLAWGRHVARVRRVDAPLPTCGEEGSLLVVRRAELRRATVAARREYTRRRRRGTDNEVEVTAGVLREAKCALRAAIRRAKADAWRELVSSFDRDSWGRPYKIVTKQLRPWAPPITETLDAQFLDDVVTTFFPTREKDIPDWVVGGRLRRLFTSCLRDGIFPRSWKTARLVLLRKESKPAESPSAYRPICLLDDAGKLLERVIAARIVQHLSRDGLNLSRGHGFRAGLDVSCGVPQGCGAVGTANVAVACVVGSIKELGLRVAPAKTEPLFFHNGKSGVPPQANIVVDDVRVPVGPTIKYLGLTVDAYRTVSYTAAMVLAGIPPAEYVADALAETFARMMVTPMTVDRLRGNARRRVFEEWRATLENDSPTTGARTVEAILPCLEQCIGRGWGGLSFRATQVLTGHGCFWVYLCRFGKKLTASCHHCDGDRDTAQHTLEACPAWAGECGVLVREIGGDLSLPAGAIVGGERAWKAFCSFCERVTSQKEEAERRRERAPGGRGLPLLPPGGGGDEGGGVARGSGIGGQRGRRLQPDRSRPGSQLAHARRRDRPTERKRRRPPLPIPEETEEE
ncbi:PO11 protein, partial [Pseudoatta argentina]